jgi:hypothetical protein
MARQKPGHLILPPKEGKEGKEEREKGEPAEESKTSKSNHTCNSFLSSFFFSINKKLENNSHRNKQKNNHNNYSYTG